ncbi:MAG: competence/damage-inducible protein A [bacterium]
MRAVILSTGDELVLGQNVDTNSAWISSQLSAHGVMSLYHKTVGDDAAAVAMAICEASRAAELVILTGGLGPTMDDVTRPALAAALGTKLVLDRQALKHIRTFFRKLNRTCPVANEVQALCPVGAALLCNNWGTAPGIRAKLGQALFLAFPGVPYEMRNMFHCYVVPLLAGRTGRTILTEAIVTFGAGESMVAEQLGTLMRRDRNPLVGTTVSEGIVTVRIRSAGVSQAQAMKRLAATVASIERRLGDLVIGHGVVSLPAVVGALLKARNMTVATAESCTGGLVAKMLTDVPGSSAWYRGGWVAYSNSMKEAQLGVPGSVLLRYGAVSEQAAKAMAEGALRRSGADFALSTTGVAGPGGGSSRKPVGTVWLALASERSGQVAVTTRLVRFPAEREIVRGYAARTALNMLRLHIQHARP